MPDNNTTDPDEAFYDHVQKAVDAMNDLTFDVGDRVRLKASGAEWWVDPKLALRAKRGVPATVIHVVGTALHAFQRSYRIKFDAIGRMRPMSEMIPIKELERLENDNQ